MRGDGDEFRLLLVQFLKLEVGGLDLLVENRLIQRNRDHVDEARDGLLLKLVQTIVLTVETEHDHTEHPLLNGEWEDEGCNDV